MKVARQFIAWNKLEKRRPVLKGRRDLYPWLCLRAKGAVDRLNHTVPLGRALF
jgi:hypothetical protein